VNSRFDPHAASSGSEAAFAASAAIVTASYAPDFERCRLLCETLDRFVSGTRHHYLLVEHRDVPLFRQLESPHRTVIDETDILPRWLHVFSDPLSLFSRRIWLSLKAPPLRGWHVQQLRRIAIAAHVAEDVLVYCDSDVAFVKPFDCAAFQQDGKVRLFRRDNAFSSAAPEQHGIWSRNAGKLLGIAAPAVSPHDYISTLITWRRASVTDMCAHIENLHGRPWVQSLAADRRFSECLVYGRFVDEVLHGKDHFHGAEEFCRVHWTGEALSDEAFRSFVGAMTPEQVAIGMQSFIGTDLGRIRRLLAEAA
jgi:hypothetical protein